VAASAAHRRAAAAPESCTCAFLPALPSLDGSLAFFTRRAEADRRMKVDSRDEVQLPPGVTIVRPPSPTASSRSSTASDC